MHGNSNIKNYVIFSIKNTKVYLLLELPRFTTKPVNRIAVELQIMHSRCPPKFRTFKRFATALNFFTTDIRMCAYTLSIL